MVVRQNRGSSIRKFVYSSLIGGAITLASAVPAKAYLKPMKWLKALPQDALVYAMTNNSSLRIPISRLNKNIIDIKGTKFSVQPQLKNYTVKRGDTLSKIARDLYGLGKLWPNLWKINKDIIHNPDIIYPGESIRYPCIGLNEQSPESLDTQVIAMPNHITPKVSHISHLSSGKTEQSTQLDTSRNNHDSNKMTPSPTRDTKNRTPETIVTYKQKVKGNNNIEHRVPNKPHLKRVKHQTTLDDIVLRSYDGVPFINMINYVNTITKGRLTWERVNLNRKNRIILHHVGGGSHIFKGFYQSDSDYNAFIKDVKKAIRHTVQATTQQGYDKGRTGCPYHFLVTPDGSIIQTNPLNTKTYSVKYTGRDGPVNTESINIAVVGNYNQENPTPQLIKALGTLTGILRENLGINRDIKGHHSYKNTDCPGKNLRKELKTINALADDYVHDPKTKLVQANSRSLHAWLDSSNSGTAYSGLHIKKEHVPDTRNVKGQKIPGRQNLPIQAFNSGIETADGYHDTHAKTIDGKLSGLSGKIDRQYVKQVACRAQKKLAKLSSKSYSKIRVNSCVALYATLNDGDRYNDKLMESIARVVGNNKLMTYAFKSVENTIVKMVDYVQFYMNGNKEASRNYDLEKLKRSYADAYHSISELRAA